MTHIEQDTPKTNLIMDRIRKLNPIENLRLKLIEEHHPYGLLLMSVPFISAAAGETPAYRIGSSGLSSSASLVEFYSDTHDGRWEKLLRDVSSFGALGMSSSSSSPEASLITTGLSLLVTKEPKDRFHVPLGSLLVGLGSSAVGSDPTLANTLRNSFDFTAPQTGAMVTPFLASVKQNEINYPFNDKIEVESNKLRVGSVVAHAYIYSGRKEFTISGGGLREPYGIKPGDKFLVLHVNQGGEQYAQMEPNTRIRAIRHDFQQLCNLLEKTHQFELSEEQKQQLDALRNAPMIGVSHLARLIAARGLPTWGIDRLPRSLQLFHTLDSQIVSRQFGGKREVRQSDIKVVFLSPQMRSQIVD